MHSIHFNLCPPEQGHDLESLVGKKDHAAHEPTGL
jgi:hypothetical protein